MLFLFTFEIMKLVFATNNRHKLDEVRKITAGYTEIASLSDIDCQDDKNISATTALPTIPGWKWKLSTTLRAYIRLATPVRDMTQKPT